MILGTSDIIALVSAVVAVVALFVSLYAAHVTRQVATSGFQSAERVKSDTANLVVALRGIMIKAALYTTDDPKTRDDEQRADSIDIRPEKAAIQSFLTSSTAIAYYDFAAKRSKKAGEKEEEWRIFFLTLVTLLRTDNTYSAGVQAAKLEKMFDTVSEEDLKGMSSGLGDLVGSIKRILHNRGDDVLLYVFVDNAGKKRASFEDFVAFLRAQGINDPDVDLFWSSANNDMSLAEDALKRGAKVSTKAGEIKSRYKALWQKFSAEQ
ncbi:MAG: hypothetical protein ABSC15_05690 [Terriglobales bacterium]|jgi:hypothetical protein